MKNNKFLKLVAVLLVTILAVGLFSVPSFAEEIVVSDEEYTDLLYDNSTGTMIIKIDGGRIGKIIETREFTREAFVELLPSGLYQIYKTGTKESVVNFLCTLAQKNILTHAEMLRLFNNKGDVLDQYLDPIYWLAPGGGEATQDQVCDNIKAVGGTKLNKDLRKFFIQTLLNEVDTMTCNGIQIFEGEPTWEFDHNAIQTVILKALPSVEEVSQLKDGDTVLDFAFSTTGPNISLEFGLRFVITGDCSYINKQAARFVDEISYVVEDSGTLNVSVTFDQRFADFYAGVLNSDKFTEARKFELLGIYTLGGTELLDAIVNEDIDEMVAMGSVASEDRAAQIESFRGLLTRIQKELKRLAPKSDSVRAFTTIADSYLGNGVFTYTMHEEFSFITTVEEIVERYPSIGNGLPESWEDLISKDLHIIDNTTTIKIADFYRVRYYDTNNQLLYVTFMPVGYDLTFLNKAAELQGHGADGWFDEDLAVTVMPAKDVDLYEVRSECDTYSGPVWNWADDFSSATATFTCTNCGDSVTLDATVTSRDDKVNNKIIYTAKVTFRGNDYTDTKSVDHTFPCEHVYGNPVWNWADDYSAATATFTCTNNCGESVTLDATVTSEEDKVNNKIIYTAKVTFQEKEHTDTKSVDHTFPCEHTYGDPVWNWADDFSSATATFTCTKDCGESVTLDATISSEEDKENNKITYTATVTFNGTVYTDKQVVTLTPPPPTGESFVWIAVAGAALIACPAFAAIIIRRKKHAL